jgi:TRAP transporter 4TM/12TM fusion protein
MQQHQGKGERMGAWFAWLKGESKLGLLVGALAVLLAVYHLVTVQVVLASYWPHLAFHLGLGLVIVFVATATKRRLWMPVLCVASLLAIAVTIYIILQSDALVEREGFPSTLDFYVGITLIVLVLTAAYISFGYVLPLLAVIGIIYAFTGPYLPQPFFHGGIDVQRLVAILTTQLGGIYGTLIYISATYLAVFLTFGAFIEGSGAASFFINLSLALFKRVKAGGGYAAVMGSALMGMGSGSPIANVLTSGTITIPLMKRAGFQPHVAGGIEAAASTGGQLMPPVMGAVAFVMADFAGVTYLNIIGYATIPAILYFLSIGFNVYFRASKLHLKAPEIEGVPTVKQAIRGADHLIPIGVLVVVLAAGYSPAFAAFWAIMCAIVLMYVRAPNKDIIKKVLSCLMSGGRRAADFAVAMACISIFVKIVLATGIGLKLPTLIAQYADGSLAKGYLLTAIASTVLGMGLPTVAAYIVVAVLAVPALTQMGADPIQAHFFVLYFSILSALTPPVALAALAGAQLADASYFKTAWVSLQYGLIAFVVPFLFVYNPGLLGLASWYSVAEAALATLLACIMTSSFIESYVIRSSRIWERALVGIGAIGAFAFVVNGEQWAIAGAVACFAAVIIAQLMIPGPSAMSTAQCAEGQAEPALRVANAWKKICSLTLSPGNKRKL